MTRPPQHDRFNNNDHLRSEARAEFTRLGYVPSPAYKHAWDYEKELYYFTYDFQNGGYCVQVVDKPSHRLVPERMAIFARFVYEMPEFEHHLGDLGSIRNLCLSIKCSCGCATLKRRFKRCSTIPLIPPSSANADWSNRLAAEFVHVAYFYYWAEFHDIESDEERFEVILLQIYDEIVVVLKKKKTLRIPSFMEALILARDLVFDEIPFDVDEQERSSASVQGGGGRVACENLLESLGAKGEGACCPLSQPSGTSPQVAGVSSQEFGARRGGSPRLRLARCVVDAERSVDCDQSDACGRVTGILPWTERGPC